LEQVVDSVAPEDDPNAIRSINITATTNDHSSGDHPPGDAVDINQINGYRISPQSPQGNVLAGDLEGAAMLNPNVRFVEGPMGIFVRPNSWSPWTRMSKGSIANNFDPKTGVYNTDYHVHISVFPTQTYITKRGH
jgi:hypothetical protein